MTDVTAEFFAALARRGQEPLLRKATGNVRFELVDGTRTDRWLLAIDEGTIAVSHKNSAADAVMRCERELFGRVVTGRSNPVTAMLRGEITASGDRRLLVLVQRLFPGPGSGKKT